MNDDCNPLVELDTVAVAVISEVIEHVKVLLVPAGGKEREEGEVHDVREPHPDPLTYLTLNFFISDLSPLDIITLCTCCYYIRDMLML